MIPYIKGPNINLERIFQNVRENSVNAKAYFVIIPSLSNPKIRGKLQLYFAGKHVDPSSVEPFRYRGKDYLLFKDFFGYDGDPDDTKARQEYLDSFGGTVFEIGTDDDVFYFTVWFKEADLYGEKQIPGNGNRMAEVDGEESGLVRCGQCGKCTCADPETGEGAKRDGGASVQSEAAAEPVSGDE